MNELTLWTCQSSSWTDALLRDGVGVPGWDHIDPRDHAAYRWMMARMQARGLHCGERPPIWAWHAGPHQPVPDLQIARELLSGFQVERGIMLITFTVPVDAVLISHYHHWCEHAYFPMAENPHLIITPQQEQEIFTPDYLDRDSRVQANVASLTRAQVVAISPFFG